MRFTENLNPIKNVTRAKVYDFLKPHVYLVHSEEVSCVHKCKGCDGVWDLSDFFMYEYKKDLWCHRCMKTINSIDMIEADKLCT